MSPAFPPLPRPPRRQRLRAARSASRRARRSAAELRTLEAAFRPAASRATGRCRLARLREPCGLPDTASVSCLVRPRAPVSQAKAASAREARGGAPGSVRERSRVSSVTVVRRPRQRAARAYRSSAIPARRVRVNSFVRAGAQLTRGRDAAPRASCAGASGFTRLAASCPRRGSCSSAAARRHNVGAEAHGLFGATSAARARRCRSPGDAACGRGTPQSRSSSGGAVRARRSRACTR